MGGLGHLYRSDCGSTLGLYGEGTDVKTRRTSGTEQVGVNHRSRWRGPSEETNGITNSGRSGDRRSMDPCEERSRDW